MDRAPGKLLGGLRFVTRTFEGTFKENPYVLDLDANLYIGPADGVSRDEHSAVEVIYHFLMQTGRIKLAFRDLLRNRLLLLDAFGAFDEARMDTGSDEFQIHLFGTYDGEPLVGAFDDELPAGPCGKSVNELKRRFYGVCQRLDKDFQGRELTAEQKKVETRFAGGQKSSSGTIR